MGFQLRYLKYKKMMVLKCCAQDVSKFGKPSSGHRTRKSQFSSQFQRRAALKDAQTPGQLHSPAMLVRLCSKSFKGFSSTWIEKFQIYKLGLEKAEEPENKPPTFVGSEKAREFWKSIYFSFIDYTKAFDWVDHNKMWEIQDGNTRPPYLPPEKPVGRLRSNS